MDPGLQSLLLKAFITSHQYLRLLKLLTLLFFTAAEMTHCQCLWTCRWLKKKEDRILT